MVAGAARSTIRRPAIRPYRLVGAVQQMSSTSFMILVYALLMVGFLGLVGLAFMLDWL